MHHRTSHRRTRQARRSGAALLLCLFVVFIVTLMVVNILDTMTMQLSVVRNTTDYERALYLANAGVHHAAAMLEDDNTWRGTVFEGTYPADNTYTSTTVDGTDDYTAQVTSSGSAGDITRTVTATIEL